jgi:hypothetical protein
VRLAAVGFALVLASSAAAARFDTSTFRYTRTLNASGGGPVAFDADGPLFAHAGGDVANLRVLDANDDQVPWRAWPERPVGPLPVRVLDAGRSDGAAVALLDLGPGHAVHDSLELDIPGGNFVGTVTVSGSDDRATFTHVGSSRVYDIVGARGGARSTLVSFAPSDFRYLRLRATGVARIAGATVSGRAQRPTFMALRARTTIRNTARTTVVSLDLGYEHMPVDAVRVRAATPRYDRMVQIAAGRPGAQMSATPEPAYRYYGTASPPIDAGLTGRLVTVTIENGDDPPLRGLHVEVLARPRTTLVEGGHRLPLRIVYGGRGHPHPQYEFARLPRSTLGLGQLRRGTLGPEQTIASFTPAPDTRSFAAKHTWLVNAALALAAFVVAAGGLVALRRR